jgi:Recombinase zinc beta ribbon domain
MSHVGMKLRQRDVNLTAHEPIVDRETWQRVQRMVVPRGRKPKSERLLARLDVLRCGSCGSRMVVGSSNHRQYAIYRCPPTGDCERRVTISAEMVEELVTSAVRAALANAEGRASAESNLHDAEVALELAQGALDAAFRAFAGFEDESPLVIGSPSCAKRVMMRVVGWSS